MPHGLVEGRFSPKGSSESKWKESGIEELWEAGEIRPLIHRVESRAHASAMGGHGSQDPLYKRGQKVTFEDERTQKMWSACLLVLKDVKTHAKAWPFLKPVNPVSDNAPNYFEIVKTPMDLATITDKLASRVYPNVAAFKSDMELVFENCRYASAPPTPPLSPRATRIPVRSRTRIVRPLLAGDTLADSLSHARVEFIFSRVTLLFPGCTTRRRTW